MSKTLNSNAKPALYGKLSDTGSVEVIVGTRYEKDGWVIDPSRVTMDVQVWTTRAVGVEQVRDFCMSVTIVGGVTDSAYEKAYRTVLGAYEDQWKALGADPDPEWKSKLAIKMGESMWKFMNEWKSVTAQMLA